MKTKEEIREDIQRKLKSQDPELLQKHSARIRDKLFQRKDFQQAKCVLITLSLKDEVDTFPIVERCLKMGKRVVVQKVNADKKGMGLREIRDIYQDTEPGVWGIREPRNDRTSEVRLEDLDYLMLPGVAFDKQGHRLGRGGGFFDRLLSQIKRSIPRIGLAFPFQIIDALPAESHDERVDITLSE